MSSLGVHLFEEYCIHGQFQARDHFTEEIVVLFLGHFPILVVALIHFLFLNLPGMFTRSLGSVSSRWFEANQLRRHATSQMQRNDLHRGIR